MCLEDTINVGGAVQLDKVPGLMDVYTIEKQNS